MNNSTSLSIRTVLLALVVLTLGTLFGFIARAVAQGPGLREETREESEARREMDEIVRANKIATGHERAFDVASRMKVSPDDFIEYFAAEERNGRRTDSSDIIWGKLLKWTRVPLRTGVTEADFEAADTVAATIGAFIRLRRSRAVDDLGVSPEELLSIQRQWTLKERANYGSVLQRAADIAAKGGGASQENAYAQALREFAEKAVKCGQ